MRDWGETVAWLKDKLNGSGLTLRLIVAEAAVAPIEFDAPMSPADCDAIHDGYMALLDPLKQLAVGENGLSRFYADLSYPWRWAAENPPRPRSIPADHWLAKEKRALERTAREYITGRPYDASSPEPAQSHWQHIHYHHSEIMGSIFKSCYRLHHP